MLSLRNTILVPEGSRERKTRFKNYDTTLCVLKEQNCQEEDCKFYLEKSDETHKILKCLHS